MVALASALSAAMVLILFAALMGGRAQVDWRALLRREHLLLIGQHMARRYPELQGLEGIERRLTWAGRPLDLSVNEFLAMRLLGAVGGVVVGYILGGGTLAVLGLLGGFAPDAWLNRLVKRRQLRIERDLAQFLDYWLAAVEAGLDLMPAVQRVAARMDGPLALEFRLAAQETEIGYPQSVALENLAKRCGVADLAQVISVLVTAERFGGSVTDQLRTAARELWAQRTARARTRAAQIGVAMRGPLLILILPGILVLMLSPVVWHLGALFN